VTWIKNVKNVYYICAENDCCDCPASGRSDAALTVDTRSAELNNIADWAQDNSLKLNLAKSQEIVFVDRRRKVKFLAPVEMSDIRRVQFIKILGVHVTNGLSVGLLYHPMSSLSASCAQALYALRVLRTHGLSDSALQTIFRAVVVAKYASSAWLGFTTAYMIAKELTLLSDAVNVLVFVPLS